MAAQTVPIQPAPRSAAISPEWLKWYNSIQQATQTIASNSTAITATAAQLATLQSEIAAAQAALAKIQAEANATLGGNNTFTGQETFQGQTTFALPPIFENPAGTRTALGIPATATPVTFETGGTPNHSQTLLNLAAGPGVLLSESLGTVTIGAVAVWGADVPSWGPSIYNTSWNEPGELWGSGASVYLPA